MNRIKDVELRQKWADKLLDYINSELFEGRKPSIEDIEKCAARPSTFQEHFHHYLELRQDILKDGTIKAAKNVYNLLALYAEKRHKKPFLDFPDFNTDFPFEFQKFCYAAPRRFTQNYVAKVLRILRQVLKDATDSGLNTGHHWRGKTYRIADTPVDSIALDFSDLEKLDSLVLPQNLHRVREVFIFACLTGLRFSDVSALTAANLVHLQRDGGGTVAALDVNTQKTGEKVIIPFHPLAAKIWARNGGALPHVYVNQVFNRYLKDLAKLAKFTEGVQIRTYKGGKMETTVKRKYTLIHTHTARRTFATIAFLEWKLPPLLIMRLTGHKSEKEFMKYIKIDAKRAALEIAAFLT